MSSVLHFVLSTFINKKTSGKLDVDLFDDLPVLQRKWQAGLRPGEPLPRYEDVMLGSLGKLADHIRARVHPKKGGGERRLTFASGFAIAPGNG